MPNNKNIVVAAAAADFGYDGNLVRTPSAALIVLKTWYTYITMVFQSSERVLEKGKSDVNTARDTFD